MCPFRVSARSSLPTRIGHTKAAPSHRAGQPARNATRIERCQFPPCGRFARCRLSSAPFKSPHSPTAISPCAPPYKPECGVQSVRVEARTALDLAPDGFNTAPSQRAGSRRSYRYAPPPSRHLLQKARCRAVSSATRPSVSLLSFSWALPLRYALSRHLRRKGQVPRQGAATRPPVSLLTPYCPGRFKGPFGSPLIVPTFTHVASASRSRPQRIVRFRRRAILRRFVPHPRKMANTRRLVLAKASHPRTNRRGRLVPPEAGSAPWVQFPQTCRPPVPFKRQELVRQ